MKNLKHIPVTTREWTEKVFAVVQWQRRESYSETLEGIKRNSHGQAVQEVTFFLLGQRLSAPRLWIAPISIKKADVKL